MDETEEMHKIIRALSSDANVSLLPFIVLTLFDSVVLLEMIEICGEENKCKYFLWF